MLNPAVLPWLNIATLIELTNCVFDFGSGATLTYPYVREK